MTTWSTGELLQVLVEEHHVVAEGVCLYVQEVTNSGNTYKVHLMTILTVQVGVVQLRENFQILILSYTGLIIYMFQTHQS